MFASQLQSLQLWTPVSRISNKQTYYHLTMRTVFQLSCLTPTLSNIQTCWLFLFLSLTETWDQPKHFENITLDILIILHIFTGWNIFSWKHFIVMMRSGKVGLGPILYPRTLNCHCSSHSQDKLQLSQITPSQLW